MPEEISLDTVMARREVLVAAIKTTTAPFQEELDMIGAYIKSLVDENPTPDTVMTRRFNLIEEIALVGAQQKAVLETLNTELADRERFIKSFMLEHKLPQLKTAAGMTYFTTKDSVVVKDMDQVVGFMLEAAQPAGSFHPEIVNHWPAILGHIKVHGMWGLLNKVINKTAAKELIEAQTPPPGIEYTAFQDLAWRRGKG